MVGLWVGWGAAHEGLMHSVKVVTGVPLCSAALKLVYPTYLSQPRCLSYKPRVMIVLLLRPAGRVKRKMPKYLVSCLACDKCSVSDSSCKKNDCACNNGYYNPHRC